MDERVVANETREDSALVPVSDPWSLCERRNCKGKEIVERREGCTVVLISYIIGTLVMVYLLVRSPVRLLRNARARAHRCAHSPTPNLMKKCDPSCPIFKLF